MPEKSMTQEEEKTENPSDITEEKPVKKTARKRNETKKAPAAEEDPYKDASLEEVFDRLEETLSKMDSPDIPLEEAFALYEQGMKMVAAADGKLKRVEQKLTVINQAAGAQSE